MGARAFLVAWVAAVGLVSLQLRGVQGFMPGFVSRGQQLQQRSSHARRSTHAVGMVAAKTEPSATMDVLKQGIKAVAVGVGGSKPIPEELVDPLIEAMGEVDKPNADIEASERLASFLGTLFVKKEITDTDAKVLAAVAARRPDLSDVGFLRAGCSAGQLLDVAGGSSASEDIQQLALKLLAGENLNEEDSYRLGKRLFDLQQPSTVISLCAHILRVRYETPDEWRGLIKAQQETIRLPAFDRAIVRDAFKRGEKNGNNPRMVVQLAEPFDGMERGQLITPLLAQHIQSTFDTVVVSQCGRTAGPKYGQNLLDIAQTLNALSAPFVHSNEDIVPDVEVGPKGIDPPELGWYVDQSEVSQELDAWVSLRRNIIKRPFLATSEKFVDTCGASVLVASAFHPSYSEKMVTCAETATDFKGCVIVRKGLEGTLGFGLGRTAEIVCGVRKEDGSYERMTYEFGPSDMGWEKETDPRDPVDAEVTAEKVKAYSFIGTSGDSYFDKRVLLTRTGLDVGLKWVMDRL